MHQRLIIIGRVEVCDDVVIIGIKVVLVTWKNFIPPDFHVIIPVSPGLLVVKSQSMKDLMLDDGLMVTPLANGQVLSHMLVTNLRPAPRKLLKDDIRALSFIGLEIHTGLEAEHFKGIENGSFGIQSQIVRQNVRNGERPPGIGVSQAISGGLWKTKAKVTGEKTSTQVFPVTTRSHHR